MNVKEYTKGITRITRGLLDKLILQKCCHILSLFLEFLRKKTFLFPFAYFIETYILFDVCSGSNLLTQSFMISSKKIDKIISKQHARAVKL